MECLTGGADKLKITAITSDLMPQGVPKIELLWQCKTISKLQAEIGSENVLKAISILLHNFSKSLNLVRNIDEDQIIEIASMMLDECHTFSLEDYQVMFTMAKRETLDFNNKKGFMDRIDIQVISKMMDAYYVFKRKEGDRIREQHEQQAMERRMKEREQRMLSAPAGSIVELPPDFFAKELKRLQELSDEIKNKEWVDYIGRTEQRKQQLKKQMADSYGMTIEELDSYITGENQKKFIAKTIPSKINKQPVNENS